MDDAIIPKNVKTCQSGLYFCLHTTFCMMRRLNTIERAVRHLKLEQTFFHLVRSLFCDLHDTTCLTNFKMSNKFDMKFARLDALSSHSPTEGLYTLA